MASRLISQAKPTYPPLAKMARQQGTVTFEATIAKDGTIENLVVVSGPPLLIPAALEAVKQWTYQPTLLNGAPVEVVTTIDVNFSLSQ
jgi:protein TonB